MKLRQELIFPNCNCCWPVLSMLNFVSTLDKECVDTGKRNSILPLFLASLVFMRQQYGGHTLNVIDSKQNENHIVPQLLLTCF